MAAKGDINKNDIQPPLSLKWGIVDFEQILVKTTIAHKLKASDFSSEGMFPVIDQGANLISGYVNDRNVLYNGELPVVIFGDHTRNIKFIDFDFAVGADGTKILRTIDNVDIKFLYYYLKTLTIPDFGYSRHYSVIKALDFPLPPLAEQERIVTKLDALFAQIEKMKLSLAQIPFIVKNFKQQVLTQAVTGKLTEKWRKTASISYVNPITIGIMTDLKPKNWNWEKLIDVAKLESGHTPRKSKEEYWINGDVQWISLQDIRKANGKTINNTLLKPNEFGIKNSSARLLPAGTVCFCRDISVGYVTIMGISMATSQHFANWICGNLLSNKYLMYSFLSSKDSLVSSSIGTTVGTIYMPALKEMRILIPPIDEQLEIVRKVDSLLAKADLIEAQYKTLKEKIENLPQTILHKAFKGELVAQLPTDGDAKDLLEEIKKLNKKLK